MIGELQKNAQTIDIGRQGENYATFIQFDLSDFFTRYPGATNQRIVLVHKRPGDSKPYIVGQSVWTESGYAYEYEWAVTSADTNRSGTGYAELRFYLGEILVKSAIFNTRIVESLMDETENPGNLVYMFNAGAELAAKQDKVIAGTGIEVAADGKTLSALGLTNEVTQLKQKLATYADVSLTGYPETNIIISSASGKWYKDTSIVGGTIFVPVPDGTETASVTASSDSVAVVAMLKTSSCGNRTAPDYATGGSRLTIAAGQTEVLSVADDCKYIAVMIRYGDSVFTPSAMKFGCDAITKSNGDISVIRNDVYGTNNESVSFSQNTAICVFKTGYNDGDTYYYASSYFSCTDFVKIPTNHKGALRITMPKTSNTSPSTYGLCFYDSNRNALKRYSTTMPFNGTAETLLEVVEVFIPKDARYFRSTWWSDAFISEHQDAISAFSYSYVDAVGVELLHELPNCRGALNAVKRARQLSDVKWTPKMNIPRDCLMNGTTDIHFLDWFYADKEYVGIPYSGSGAKLNSDSVADGHLAVDWGYTQFLVGLEVGIDTFLTAARYPNSILGTRTGRTTWYDDASPYGSFCTALVSYAYDYKLPIKGVSIFYQSTGLKLVTALSNPDLSKIRVADMMHGPGHVILISDILRDSSGNITHIECTEETTVGNGNNASLGTKRGGVARRKTWDLSAWLSIYSEYSIYRPTAVTSVPYESSLFVDSGEGDGLGVFDMACIPYLGHNARYKQGHIVSSKILIGATGFAKMVVKKDGEAFGEFAINGQTEISVGFSEVGSYEAYLETSDGKTSGSCLWTVE